MAEGDDFINYSARSVLLRALAKELAMWRAYLDRRKEAGAPTNTPQAFVDCCDKWIKHIESVQL